MEGQRYAGFWIRVCAFIIDSIVLSLISVAVAFAFGLVYSIAMQDAPMMEHHMPMGGHMPMGVVVLVQLFSVVVGWLYKAGMESSVYQATVGKIVLQIYVTDLEGQRLSFGRASGRWLGSILSGILLGIGYIMVAFTEKKQGLHDFLAGTFVLRR